MRSLILKLFVIFVIFVIIVVNIHHFFLSPWIGTTQKFEEQGLITKTYYKGHLIDERVQWISEYTSDSLKYNEYIISQKIIEKLQNLDNIK